VTRVRLPDPALYYSLAYKPIKMTYSLTNGSILKNI